MGDPFANDSDFRRLLRERLARPQPVAVAVCRVCKQAICDHSDMEFAGITPPAAGLAPLDERGA
jgi:hypothetical protein